MNLGGILLLCLNKPTSDLDGIEFIGPDAAKENLIVSLFGIEVPLVAFLDYRNRKWPIIITNRQDGSQVVLRVHGHGFLFASFRGKCFSAVLVLHWVRRGDKVFTVLAEELHHGRDIVVFCCFDQRVCGLPRRGK